MVDFLKMFWRTGQYAYGTVISKKQTLFLNRGATSDILRSLGKHIFFNDSLNKAVSGTENSSGASFSNFGGILS